MITFDGERSRKRLPVAKKALANITDLGLPAKASMFEGFTYKVWQMDRGKLTGGRITAPAGIFVMLSDEAGFKQFVCDSFQTIAAPIFDALLGDRYAMLPSPMPAVGAGLSAVSGTSLGGSGAAAQETDAATIVQTDPLLQWSAPTPVCLPLAGEFVLMHLGYERLSNHLVNVTQAVHCHSDGSGDTASPAISRAWSTEDETATTANSARTIPLRVQPDYFEYIDWKTGDLFAVDGKRNVLRYEGAYLPTGAVFGVYPTVDQVMVGASADLKNKVAIPGDYSMLQIAAHYSRTAADIKGVCALRVVGASESEPFILSLCFVSLATAHQAVSYPILKESLETLGFVIADVDDAQIALGMLFGWPAESELTGGSRDTVTFADAAGSVYSWHRTIGGVKFQVPEGVVEAALVMPPEVLADATLRPRILLMAETVYCCLAGSKEGAIIYLYVGSPFAAWEEVALPDGVTMYSVRVMQPGETRETTGFIGIGKDVVEGVATYRVYLKLAGREWVGLSPIPATAVNDTLATWDVCVFGNDPIARAMQQVRQHPTAIQSRRPSLR